MIKFGREFEDFEIGQIINHAQSKTITESDNNIFSLITMNHHPVHINQVYAKSAFHGKILVNGTLTFSLSVGITVADISAKAIANLGYNNIDHKSPVFINDTISVNSKIISKNITKSDPKKGIVKILSQTYNQDNKEVLSFERKILLNVKT